METASWESSKAETKIEKKNLIYNIASSFCADYPFTS